MAWSGVITNVGAALLETWAAGSSTLTILSANAGEGYVASASAQAQTALVSAKQTASIISAAASAGGQRFKLQLSPPQTGYTLNQLGIWAKVGTGTSTLLALFQNPDGVAIPAASVNPDFVYTFYATLTMSNSGTISVTVDSSAVVSQSTMESYVASAIAAALPSPSTATPAMDGVGAAGSSTAWARGDHVHPSDTSRQAKITVSGLLKGDGNGGVSAAAAGTDYQAPIFWYGTCNTAAATQQKDVTCAGFTLANGVSIRVLFANIQEYDGQPTLNVNNTGAKGILRRTGNVAVKGDWRSGQIVDFVYDGTNWIMVDGGMATTEYYGFTKLSSATDSTSETLAATPKAVKTVMDAIPAASSTTPKMDGTAAVGTGTTWAKADHVHPSDTGRQAKITASGILKGDGSGGVSAAAAGTDYAPAYTYSTTDLTAGTSSLTTGKLYFVYE